MTERIKRRPFASVCFITDAGNCSGNKYGGANTPDNSSSGGTPSGSSSGSSSSGGDEDWTIDNRKRCELEGYKLTSCPALKVPQNYCPYDISYFEKCVCKAGLVTCTKPYYGVGESCDGKYASCKLDNARGCKEDGYTQTGACNSVQVINKKCPYDPTYFDKCVCRSDLVSCPTPLQGVGTACGGKYKSCKCPSKYKSCDCGKAAGASSCTWNGVTKYSSCKACCTPYRDEISCSCGTYSCSDGCGGYRKCCKSCSSSSSSSSSGSSGSSSSGSSSSSSSSSSSGSSCRKSPWHIRASITTKTTCENISGASWANGAKSRDCRDYDQYICYMTETTPDENGCYQRSAYYCFSDMSEAGAWTFERSGHYCNMEKGYSNSDCTGSTISFTW